MKRLAALSMGLVVAIGSAAPGAGPAGPFLCIVEQATGFGFDKESKAWRQTNFGAGEKYVLKRVKSDSLGDAERGMAAHRTIAGTANPAWGVWRFGDNFVTDTFCAEDVDDHGYLWCRGPELIFNVNLRSHRFLRTYAGTYVRDPSEFPDEHADTPVMEIGKCTEL